MVSKSKRRCRSQNWAKLILELASSANINRNSQVSFEQKFPAFRIGQGYYEKHRIACAGLNDNILRGKVIFLCFVTVN